jgi:CRISPR-associated endonuclease/helicase Cas3
LLSSLPDTIERWLQRDSQATTFSYEQREYVSLLRGLMMSSDHIGSALPNSNYVPNIPKLSDFGFCLLHPYGFQVATSKHKGNLILRAPTGSGKTEAALLWAHLNQRYNGRMFYALPTTASINAMYRRLCKNFSEENVGLLHSRTVSSLYSMFEEAGDRNGDGDSDDKARQNKARTIGSLVREMYFPIRVCTPHQILRYTLQGKGWEAMLSEFPHSVFVFDEYNPKLTGLTLATAKYLTEHKATVMFLTATLPTFLKKMIEAELTVEFIQPSYDNANDRKILEQKRHIVEPRDGNVLDNIQFIIREADKVRSTLVVCNHINTAQQVSGHLKKEVNDTVLLHSRFNRCDRNRIEKDLQASLPKILVATQVVEVSLDIDFQQGFTEPAAIDALVQRMGRINRQARRDPAHVYIFREQCSDSNIPYRKKLRDDSLKRLTGLPMPLSEEDLNQAVDEVYGNGYADKDLTEYNEGLNYKELKEFKRCLTAGTSADWVEVVMESNEGTVEILPFCEPLYSSYNGLKADGKTIPANDLLVPIGNWMIPRLVKDGRLDTETDPYLLSGCKYSEDVGLEVWSEVNTMI